MNQPTTQTASAIPRPAWIVGKKYDQFFLFGGWLVPFVLFFAMGLSPMAAFLAFALLDGAHVWVTAPLTVLDKTSDAQTQRFYRWGGAALLAMVVLVTVSGGIVATVWRSVFLYWGAFHIVRQHYGFLKLYQLRSGNHEPQRVKIETWFLYVGLAAPYLYMQSIGSAFFAKEGLLRIPLPLAVPLAALFVAVGLGSYLALLVVRDARAGRSIGKLRLLHLALAISNWVIAVYLGAYYQSIALVALFFTSFHDVQYHAVIWHVGRRRYDSEGRGNPFAFLFRPGRLFVYLGLALGFGLLRPAMFGFGGGDASWLGRHALLDFSINLAWGINFIHYLYDGKMWQMRHNKQLRTDLDLSGPPRPGPIVASDPAPAE